MLRLMLDKHASQDLYKGVEGGSANLLPYHDKPLSHKSCFPFYYTLYEIHCHLLLEPGLRLALLGHTVRALPLNFTMNDFNVTFHIEIAQWKSSGGNHSPGLHLVQCG